MSRQLILAKPKLPNNMLALPIHNEEGHIWKTFLMKNIVLLPSLLHAAGLQNMSFSTFLELLS
jgi:hypothetical protein